MRPFLTDVEAVEKGRACLCFAALVFFRSVGAFSCCFGWKRVWICEIFTYFLDYRLINFDLNYRVMHF